MAPGPHLRSPHTGAGRRQCGAEQVDPRQRFLRGADPLRRGRPSYSSECAGGSLPFPSVAELRAAPWWSYTGGLIVAFYVFTITFLAPRLGVGTAIALIVTGQIAAALAIDHFGLLRSLTFQLTMSRVAGAVLMVGGAFLALRR